MTANANHQPIDIDQRPTWGARLVAALGCLAVFLLLILTVARPGTGLATNPRPGTEMTHPPQPRTPEANLPPQH